MPAVKELHEEYTEKLKELRDLAVKAETEDRDFTAEEREEVKRRTEELKDLKGKITETKGDDELRDAIKALGDDIGVTDDNGDGPAPVQPGKGKSIGERFVNSPEFKDFIGRFPEGRIPDSAKGLMSPPVQFKDVITGGADTSGGAFVSTDVTGIYEGLGRRPLTVRDLISNRQTGSDTVEFVRQTTQVDAAATVAEATGTADGTGAKPEGSMAFEKVTASVSTIAVWVPATKRALSDAAQLRGLIDDELRDDLEQELEDQILNGDGTGENFTGLSNTANVQAQAWDTDLLTTTRRARTKVRTVGRAQASAYLLHPNDWERIDLLQDNENRYFFGGPAQIGTPRLWGLPVVESEGVTEGVGYVGDFRKAALWDREQASIQVSDSHTDFFVRNLVAVLAELRAAFGVIRPTAFVEMDLTSA